MEYRTKIHSVILTRVKHIISTHKIKRKMNETPKQIMVTIRIGSGARALYQMMAPPPNLVVADLLGTNSECRTCFFYGSWRELAEVIMLTHESSEELMHGTALTPAFFFSSSSQ
jgi:hypothetical protein